VPVHDRHAIKASPDENYVKLRIGLKRRLFDFFFYIYIYKDLCFVLFVSFSGLRKNLTVVL
jgi:hypothetical protein